MNRRYYDGYNTYHRDFPKNDGEVIIPESAETESVIESENNVKSADTNSIGISAFNLLPDLGGLFPNFALDDVILLGILIVLLHDGTDDTILLIAIGFLFLTGLKR